MIVRTLTDGTKSKFEGKARTAFTNQCQLRTMLFLWEDGNKLKSISSNGLHCHICYFKIEVEYRLYWYWKRCSTRFRKMKIGNKNLLSNNMKFVVIRYFSINKNCILYKLQLLCSSSCDKLKIAAVFTLVLGSFNQNEIMYKTKFRILLKQKFVYENLFLS